MLFTGKFFPKGKCLSDTVRGYTDIDILLNVLVVVVSILLFYTFYFFVVLLRRNLVTFVTVDCFLHRLVLLLRSCELLVWHLRFVLLPQQRSVSVVLYDQPIGPYLGLWSRDV